MTRQFLRREIVYRGNVQGVGFRYRTCQVASGYAITGYVRNQDDGSVALVAEGDREELDAFISELEACCVDHIRSKQDQACAANGEFVGFDIRR